VSFTHGLPTAARPGIVFAVPSVHFTANLQRHVACPSETVQGATVAECLEAVFAHNPRARGYVLDEHGAVRKHMNVFVDNEQVVDRETLSDPVRPDSEIYVMQALSGG
jgi:molybdopterin converting factor small subunit